MVVGAALGAMEPERNAFLDCTTAGCAFRTVGVVVVGVDVVEVVVAEAAVGLILFGDADGDDDADGMRRCELSFMKVGSVAVRGAAVGDVVLRLPTVAGRTIEPRTGCVSVVVTIKTTTKRRVV